MRRLFHGGARMLVCTQGEAIAGPALWRILENTMFGKFLYVDDLATDPALRSRGIGTALLFAMPGLSESAHDFDGGGPARL